MKIEDMAAEYCLDYPELGKIIERDGKPGILFTGIDSPTEGEFIPFDDLGYSKTFGYFQKSLFPNTPDEATR